MPYVSVQLDEQRLRGAMRRFLRDAVPEVADTVVRKTAFDVVALYTRALNGVDGLPKRIDTGRLRAASRMALEDAGISSAGISAPASLSGDNPTQAGDGTGSVRTGVLRTTATVSNNVEYARYVEDGTSKMAPGHHLKRALRRAAESFEDGLRRGVKAEFG